MLGRAYAKQNCSAARALEMVGERWSLLILRDVLFRGMSRFSQIQRSLGVATNILSSRLDGLIAHEILERRVEPGDLSATYWPTEMAFDFKPTIMALTAWGDRWASPNGRPVVFRHLDCGGKLKLSVNCSGCGERPAFTEVVAFPVPDA